MEDMAKVHTSSPLLDKGLLTAEPLTISETAALDQCLVIYRLWLVFTALRRLCEYEKTFHFTCLNGSLHGISDHVLLCVMHIYFIICHINVLLLLLCIKRQHLL